jgi:hypothetical protein
MKERKEQSWVNNTETPVLESSTTIDLERN